MPCIKLWGPRKEQQLLLSRVGTPAEAVIDPADELTLEWLYYKGIERTGVIRDAHMIFTRLLVSFAQYFVPIYGASITSLPFRHALISCLRFIIPGENRHGQRVLESANRAIGVIGRKSHSKMDEGDLFASALLAYQTYINLTSSREEYSTHIKGFMSLLKLLSSRADKNTSTVLGVFWPLARDLLLDLSYEADNDEYFELAFLCREIMGAPNLEQRIRYSGCTSWWAYHHVLLLHLDLLCMAMRRMLTSPDNKMTHVMAVISDVKTDLQSMDEPDFIAKTGLAFVNADILAQFHMQKHTCKLLVSVLLSEQGIILALKESAVVQSEAQKILDLMSKLVTMYLNSSETEVFDYYWNIQYWSFRRGLGVSLLAYPLEFDLVTLMIGKGESSLFALVRMFC
jgi:hypothetical protein